VLDHARFLVIRFFNRERVVLDSFREQLSSRTGDERRVQENDKRQVTRFARGYARSSPLCGKDIRPGEPTAKLAADALPSACNRVHVAQTISQRLHKVRREMGRLLH
jgi:hypothetical protein